MSQTLTHRQNAFNAGELSPRIKGRSDLSKYTNGLALCENAWVLPHGGAMERSGTYYINEVKDSDDYAELIPFEYSETQAYVLEFGDYYMRVYTDGGIVVTPDSDTVLLLHMDGLDGAVTFTDEGVTGHTVTSTGNAQVDTGDYKFATGSLMLDGTGDYLSIADHADFDFDASPWTIDFWATFDTTTKKGIQTFYFQGDTTESNYIWIYYDFGNNRFFTRITDGTNVLSYCNVEELQISPPNDWMHYAVVDDGTNVKTYGDGSGGANSGKAWDSPNLDGAVQIGSGPGTTTFLDWSPVNAIITAAGGTVISDTEQKLGKASIYFDGTDDNLSFPGLADYNFATVAITDMTISLWVKHADHVGTEPYICQYIDADNYWVLQHVHGTGLQFVSEDATVVEITVVGAEITDTNWHHIMLAHDQLAGNKRHIGIYLDGDQVGYSSLLSTDTLVGTMYIGAMAANYYEGYIDEVEIAQVLRNGIDPMYPVSSIATFTSSVVGYANNVGISMDPLNGKYGIGSIAFDGTVGEIIFDDNSWYNFTTQTQFCMECWVKHTDHVGTEVYAGQYADATHFWYIANIHGTGLQFSYDNGSGPYTMTGTEISDTNWHHVAVMRDVSTGNVGLYDDGAQIAYIANASFGAGVDVAADLYLGNYNAGSFFDGNLTDFRIQYQDSYGCSPVVGLTDTITPPSIKLIDENSTTFLVPLSGDSVSVPTATLYEDIYTEFLLRGDLTDCEGWIDELRVSTTARWSSAFDVATQEYPGAGGYDTYELVTPYPHSTIDKLRVVQSADTLYIAHPDYNVRKIQRTRHDLWTITDIDWAEPPWNTINTTAITLDPSATTGTGITVVASASFFTNAHIGAYFKQTATGYYRITAVASPLSATADVKVDLADHVATTDWYQGKWDGTQSFPTALTFHEDRLILAGCSYDPLKVFMSKTGDYESFATGTADDDAIIQEVWSQKQNAIEWLLSGQKLFIGTAGSEFWVSGETVNTPITPTSILIRKESDYGSGDVAPVGIGNSILFVQKGGKRVRDWAYNSDDEGYDAIDLSILAEHLTKTSTISKVQYAQDPHGILWCTDSNGYLLGLTYLKEHEVVGWHVHYTGATDTIESIAIIPGTLEDEVWVLVKRTVNSLTKRYVEQLQPQFYGMSLTSAFFVDSGLSSTGTPTDTFSGLSHLEGETVSVLADGEYDGDYTVSSGSITISAAATTVHIGLPFNMNIKTLMPETGTEGSMGNKTKRIVEGVFEMYETGSMSYGRDSSNLLDAGLTAAALNTDEYLLEMNGEFDYAPSIYVRQDEPLPFTMLAITYRLDVEDD